MATRNAAGRTRAGTARDAFQPTGRLNGGQIDAGDVAHEEDEGSEAGLFVFDARPDILDWPVTVRKPGNGGAITAHKIRMDFAYVDAALMQELHDALSAWNEAGGKPGDADDPVLPYVIGWSHIAQQGKGELAFSTANARKLLADQDVRQAVFVALQRLVARLEEKNFETPADDGPALSRKQRRVAGKALAKALK